MRDGDDGFAAGAHGVDEQGLAEQGQVGHEGGGETGQGGDGVAVDNVLDLSGSQVGVGTPGKQEREGKQDGG